MASKKNRLACDDYWQELNEPYDLNDLKRTLKEIEKELAVRYKDAEKLYSTLSDFCEYLHFPGYDHVDYRSPFSHIHRVCGVLSGKAPPDKLDDEVVENCSDSVDGLCISEDVKYFKDKSAEELAGVVFEALRNIVTAAKAWEDKKKLMSPYFNPYPFPSIIKNRKKA